MRSVPSLGEQPTVERVSDVARLAALVPAWDALLDEAHPGAVFRSPAWLLPWWDQFAPGNELSVYAAWRGARLIGLLPTYRAPTRLGGHRLRLLGDGIVGSDHLGVVTSGKSADAAEAEVAARAIATAILRGESDLAFDGLYEDDPLLPALTRAALRDGAGGVTTDEQLPCPYLDVRAAGDFAGWLASLDNGAGAQLKRRRRWLEKQPGFRLEVLDGESEVAAALPALWRLHHARWAVEGGSDAVDSPAVEAFHDAAARSLARRGVARVYLLHVDGAPRAALYGFRRGPRFGFYQSGNEPEWRQRSVGTVILCAAIEDTFRDGLAEFDFLRGTEAYKKVYASGARGLVGVRHVSGARATALRAIDDGVKRGRALVRDLLPPPAVEWFRRQRRRLQRGAAGLAAGTGTGPGTGTATGPGTGPDAGTATGTATGTDGGRG